ncbi:MAG TPA: flavodoxin domain-containing protein, partial [Thermoanaerobaculia bacterium]|nr:flavodoxin domain-containing protein [Thermoanaerobaculia bacterium]
MKRKLLVVYASRFGQTETIARRIAEIAQREGIASQVVEVNARAEGALGDATDVVVAGAVYFGRHLRALSEFVRSTRAELLKRHTAFVSVCGAADEPDARLDEARTYVDKFLRQAGWTPDTSVIFGGAIAYTRYGWFLRFLMRRIARTRGLGTDTARDYDYTDWNAVDAFA